MGYEEVLSDSVNSGVNGSGVALAVVAADYAPDPPPCSHPNMSGASCSRMCDMRCYIDK